MINDEDDGETLVKVDACKSSHEKADAQNHSWKLVSIYRDEHHHHFDNIIIYTKCEKNAINININRSPEIFLNRFS